jgi:hypothetical protein
VTGGAEAGGGSGTVTYGVRRGLVLGLGGAAFAISVVAALTPGPGQLLLVVIAVGCWFEAIRGLRPTLVADADGVLVVVGLRTERHPWSAVEAVGSLRPPAAGARPRRRANALELDLGDRLLVLPGYRLGAPVDEVVAALSERATTTVP